MGGSRAGMVVGGRWQFRAMLGRFWAMVFGGGDVKGERMKKPLLNYKGYICQLR